MDFEAIIAELTAEIHRLNDLLSAEQAQNAALAAEVKKLREQVEQLTHKKNSNNSSVPPSTEHFSKPDPKSLRTKSGRAPGGQKNHTGSGMKVDREPDEVKSYIPPRCVKCPRFSVCNQLKCKETRYEYEAVVETKLIAHKVMGCKCSESGEQIRGTFPAGITGSKQYGAGVFGLVLSLMTVGYMSVDRIRKLLASLGIPISTGACQNMMDRAGEAAELTDEFIKEKVTGKDVVHFDETGLRVDKVLNWLHCACSGKWRYYSVQERRGAEGMNDMGVLPNFKGIAVHDFWSSYKKFKEVIHAMCCQHLERELVYAEETGKHGPGSFESCFKVCVTQRILARLLERRGLKKPNWINTWLNMMPLLLRGYPQILFLSACLVSEADGKKENSDVCSKDSRIAKKISYASLQTGGFHTRTMPLNRQFGLLV